MAGQITSKLDRLPGKNSVVNNLLIESTLTLFLFFARLSVDINR